MATNEQRREAAKRKLDRQLARRAERAKRRKIVGAGVTVGAVVIVAGVVVFLVTRGETGASADAGATGSSKPSPTSQPAAKATSGPCHYTPTQGNRAAKKVALPPDPKPTPSKGTVHVAMKTNVGTIDLTLNRAKAPCTVQSIVHLVKSDFYANSPCHRLVTADSLSVLQCGDPTGTGKGGPGYSIPDEPPSNLKPAGKGKTVIYPRGTVAMAKSRRPDSGGSQFFMVYKDSQLPPTYTVFGKVAPEDMAMLDKVGAAGTKNGRKSGPPNMQVTINDVTLVNS